jgi:putative oxidoreductase
MTNWSWIFSKLLEFVIRLVLASVFILGGILKMDSIQQFSDNVAAYQILPFYLINLVALSLPPFEVLCGLLVLSGFLIRVGTLAMIILLVIFSIALFGAILRGLPIDCGCLGGLSWMELNPKYALLRDVLFLLLSVILYRWLLPKRDTAIVTSA